MKAEIAVLVLFTLLFACLALSLVAAAQPCLTGADQEPCDGSVTLAELMDYVGEWYACSSCVPDMFQSIQAYYGIPFCGDHSCDAGLGENCSSCEQDCGNCIPGSCDGISECHDYTDSANCTNDPCNVSGNCQWNGTDCAELEAASFDGWRVLPIRTQWEFENGKIGGEGEQLLHGMARSLSDPNVIYWSQDVAGPWKSTNAGESWQKTLGKDLYIVHGLSIEVDPFNPDIVFIIVFHRENADLREKFGGLYKSTDGGDSWTLVLNTDTGVDNTNWRQHRRYTRNIAYDLASRESNKAKVWYTAFVNNGLYRSDDYGNNWNKVADLSSHDFIYGVYSHPTDGQTVYLASGNGLFVSHSQGTNLQLVNTLPTGEVTSVAISPQSPTNIVYVTIKNQGLYSSTDSGNTFTLLKQYDAWRVFMNPGFPDTLYLLGFTSDHWSKSPILITHDAGLNWTENKKADNTAHPGYDNKTSQYVTVGGGGTSAVALNAQDPNEAVVYHANQFYKTTDGGVHFRESSDLFTGYAIWLNSGFVFDRFDPNRFALFLCDVIMVITKTGGDWFYKITNTVDGGNPYNWRGQGVITAQGAVQSVAGDLQPIENSEKMVATIGDYAVGADKVKLMYLENESVGWDIASDIEFIKVEHLDSSRTVVLNDITDKVKKKDDDLSEEINNNEYVRITFVSNLTKNNDIRAHINVSGTSDIGLYVKDDDTLITNFSKSQWINMMYSTPLTNLTGEENTFDLKINGDPVQFDSIFEHRNYNIKFVAYHQNDPNIVYAGDLKSYDGGKSFKIIEFKNEIEGAPSYTGAKIFSMCQSNPDVVYAIYHYSKGILRSDDAGETWRKYHLGSWRFDKSSIHFPTFAVDPVDCNIVYTIDSSGDIAVYNGSEWRSLGLLPLVERPENMDISVGTLAIDPRNNSIIYASIGGGSGISSIWRSTDKGQTWEDISYNLPRKGYPIVVNPHTGELFAGGAVGTWIFPPPYNSSNLVYNKAYPMPSCYDGLQNGDETGVDSGGSCA